MGWWEGADKGKFPLTCETSGKSCVARVVAARAGNVPRTFRSTCHAHRVFYVGGVSKSRVRVRAVASPARRRFFSTVFFSAAFIRICVCCFVFFSDLLFEDYFCIVFAPPLLRVLIRRDFGSNM